MMQSLVQNLVPRRTWLPLVVAVGIHATLPARLFGFEVAEPFGLASRETGSTRFTNSNAVDLVDFPVPPGYSHFQITRDGDPSALGDWLPTSEIPDRLSFAAPAEDGNVTHYAWFTNTADTVALMRGTGEIVYTRQTLPQPTAPAALTRKTAGFTVRITGDELDTGSTGGTFADTPLDIFRLETLWTGGPHGDMTPEAPYVTLTNVLDTYEIRLRVINEAGNVATSSVCAVTLVAATDAPSDGDRYVAVGNQLAAFPYDTWETAAASIQTAVNATTADGETLRVWSGRYTVPTNAVSGDGSLNVVNISRPLILRSVAGRAHTRIDGEGVNRGLRIAYSQNVPPFVLDGFTVTNGYAANGGGVFYASGGNHTHYLNSLFAGNVAEDSGGAMRDSQGSTVVISNSVFRQNHALHDTQNNRGGGAIFKNSGTISIYDSLFEGNRANTVRDASGGAIYINGGTIERTLFLDNRSHLTGNAGSGGGAIHNRGNLHLRNCLVYGNAGQRGGGIYLPSSSIQVVIENCTITGNHSGNNNPRYSAGGIWSRSGTPTLEIYNSIVYGNTGGPNINFDVDVGATVMLHSCTTPKDIHPGGEAGFDADGNIDVDPSFVDPDNGNFRLSRESPCVNAGINQEWMAGAVDLDGKPRVDGIHNQVDMGAYEFQYPGTILMIR